MEIYKKAINHALRNIRIARDLFVIDHDDDVGIELGLNQFEHAIIILERMRDYKKEGDADG